MSERNDGYPRWVSPDRWTAYRQELEPDGTVSITGLVLYGPVDSTRLRQLNFRTMLGRGPKWNRSVPPPSDEELRKVVRRRRLATGPVARGALTRNGSESPDDFYSRVAGVYEWLADNTGKPLTEIARIANVPRSTAARWIREARRRGHLPPTTRGRVS